METSLEGKRVLVLGGTGSIGAGVVAALLSEGAVVHVLSRNLEKACDRLQDFLYPVYGVNSRLTISEGDVTDPERLGLAEEFFAPESDAADRNVRIDAIIYSVGNCPPHGFDGMVATPLTCGDATMLLEELQQHVVGLANVAQQLLRYITPGGHLVVIGSAITRLTDEQCPPWLYAGRYAAAKAAQDELLRWLRRDPMVKQNRILIHRLAPAAVNTPFHQGCRRSPPAMLTVPEVAAQVLAALHGEAIVDKMLVPARPA